MFEQYKEMSEDERARVREIHRSIKSDWSNTRYRNLAWGFVRGFKCRRIERQYRTQIINNQLYEHNRPFLFTLAKFLAQHIKEFKDATKEWNKEWSEWSERGERTELIKKLDEWLKDPTGAIAAPPPRPKKIFTQKQLEATL